MRHDITTATKGTDWHAAADDLAQTGQIRRHAIVRLCAAEGDTNPANSAATATTTVTNPDTAGPRMTVSAAALRLDGQGRISLTLRCPSAEASGPCTGTVSLRSLRKLDPARILTAASGERGLAAKRFLALGKAPFTVVAGTSRLVRVKIPKTGRAVIRALGSLRAVAIVKAVDAKGNKRAVSRAFTLRPKAKPKPA